MTDHYKRLFDDKWSVTVAIETAKLAEREACAKVAEEYAKEMWGFTEAEDAAERIAAAIRARGEGKE